MAEQHKPLILIVDDHAEVRAVLEEVLGTAYAVAAAPGGAEAIQWLGEHRAQAQAIVLDLAMPEMSGFRVLEYLEWARQHTPVVIYTARVEMAEAVRRQRLPRVQAVLTKPASRADLLTAVAKAVAGAG